MRDPDRGGLTLARRVGERVIIEADGRIVAVVELAEATPGHARLRIRAPRDVTIARSEVYRRNGAATGVTG